MATKPPSSPNRLPEKPFFKTTLGQAWDLFVFSSMFAVLFNLFYAYGIELKVPSVKKSGIQELVKSSPSPTDSPGWGQRSKTPSSPKSLSTPTPSSNGTIPRVSINRVQDRFQKGSCVFIDARKPEEYAEGHIPGALDLYGNEVDKYIPNVVPQLSDRNQEIIAYCHGGDCDLSLQAAKALIEAGYTHVEVFEGGWPDWKKSGLPIHTGETP